MSVVEELCQVEKPRTEDTEHPGYSISRRLLDLDNPRNHMSEPVEERLPDITELAILDANVTRSRGSYPISRTPAAPVRARSSTS